MGKHDIKVLIEAETSFGSYRVVEMIYNERPSRVLFSGPNMNAQSGIALDGHPRLLFDYNQRFMEMVEQQEPKSVLVLGGGAYTFPTAVQRARPGTRIVVVERDDILADLAARYFEFNPADEVVVVEGDARDYLEQIREQFDLIIVDVFAGDRIPPELVSSPSIQRLADSVTDGGIVGINLIGVLHGAGSGATAKLVDEFQKHFDEVQIAPATIGSTVWGRQNLVLRAVGPTRHAS